MAPPRTPHRRAFTLLELAGVLAVLAILTSIAVPALSHQAQRARALEARSLLEAIAHAELAWHKDTGGFLALPPTPKEIPAGPVPFLSTGPWRALGIHVAGAVHHQYEVTLADGSFRATARGDFDGSGTVTAIHLDGRTLGVALDPKPSLAPTAP
jgi:prepilin-type N-terminal cleavage/methylation domain-containing protein